MVLTIFMCMKKKDRAMKIKTFVLGLCLVLLSTGLTITHCNMCDILYDYGKLYGVVTDESNNLIEGATVIVEKSFSQPFGYETTTNNLGQYSFEKVKFYDFNYTISADYMNMSNVEDVYIGPDNSESGFSCNRPEVEKNIIIYPEQS